MSIDDAELARTIEQSTAQYDKVRSLDIVYRMGADAVRDALQEEEIASDAFAALSPEEQHTYTTDLTLLLNNDLRDSSEPTPYERYIDAEVDFDERLRPLLGRIDGSYWFGSIEPSSIWLRTEKSTHATRAGDLSMVILRAHARGTTVQFTKEKRFGRDKQDLRVTNGDKAVMMQAAKRLKVVAADIEANG